MGRTDRNLFFLMVAWAAFVLLLLSPDSPLHGPWGRCDSAIFFSSGKALMSGMRPYVDFADSKGPLLWLIYGIGYLLSPRSYTGLYVVSVFVYAGIFYYNFKTARIFLKDDRRSLMVMLLMSFAYFLQWLHFEVRAEDFATLPVAVSLYWLFRVIYGCGNDASRPAGGEEKLAEPVVRSVGLALGGCFMALLLIKWSTAAMQGVMLLCVLWIYGRERGKSVSLTAWMAAGAAAMAIPFLLYLWLRGAVPAFINEYFVNTVSTIETDSAEDAIRSSYLRELSKAWGTPASQVLLLGIVYGGYMIGRSLPRYRCVPLIVGVFFFALATRHNLGYYYDVCTIFLIYPLMHIISTIAHKPRRMALLSIVAAFGLWGVYINVNDGYKLHEVAVWNHVSEERRSYETIAGMLTGKDKPRILNLFYLDMGFGLEKEALPSGRYWTYQLGSTPAMDKEHVRPLESGSADYVIVFDEIRGSAKGFPPGKVISYGYKRCLRFRHSGFGGATVSTAVYRKAE